MTKKRRVTYLVIILALAAFLRLWQLNIYPPGLYSDEAMNGSNALEAIKNTKFLAGGESAFGGKLFYPENNGREGLFINIQAISVSVFGNKPWALRGVSAIFGILTVLGLYLLVKELFKNERLALFSAFLLATSFWHLMFSRIGFRAIMAPFFMVWSFYFLWLAIGRKFDFSSFRLAVGSLASLKIKAGEEKSNFLPKVYAAIAGVIFGLGFHSYIAYRAMPVLLIFPFYILWKNKQKKIIAVFILASFIAVLPLLLYFLKNPQDFLGRTSQISVFSSVSPIKALATNTLKTVGMFFTRGDENWRHNFAGAPELWWPVSLLFLLGIAVGIKNLFKNAKNIFLEGFLFLWLILALAPVIISNEGLPHALRAIIAIPPVMIFVALGLEKIVQGVENWLKKKTITYPDSARQLSRIKKEMTILLFAFLATLAIYTYSQYFLRWATKAETYNAFNGHYADIAKYLNTLPNSTEKYVIVNANGVLAKNIPMPAQTIMFLTDTYVLKDRGEKKITYLLPEKIGLIKCESACVVVTMEMDSNLRNNIKQIIPALKLNIGTDIEYLKN
ncbi:MAG: glycosyltransferase family 39 protein [bacterium]|nr:glycosyltransferase family 39 protein [bacterium]